VYFLAALLLAGCGGGPPPPWETDSEIRLMQAGGNVAVMTREPGVLEQVNTGTDRVIRVLDAPVRAIRMMDAVRR
jgi:hypothetical protein